MVGVGVGVGAGVGGRRGLTVVTMLLRTGNNLMVLDPETSAKKSSLISAGGKTFFIGKKYQEWTEADKEEKQIHQPERVIVVKERSCCLLTKAASASHIPGVQPLKVQEDRKNTHTHTC